MMMIRYIWSPQHTGRAGVMVVMFMFRSEVSPYCEQSCLFADGSSISILISEKGAFRIFLKLIIHPATNTVQVVNFIEFF